MAGGALTLFNDNSDLPAEVAGFLEGESNIDPRNTVPQLSFRGKVFRTVIGGDETPILNKDDEPVQSINVVIIDFNKARSRSYYEGEYVEGKSKPPVCWSSDGEKPDDAVQDKQSESCATCQWSAKGSKVSNSGKAITACSPFKRMAIAPLEPITRMAGGEQGIEFELLLLRLAQTSMWDKNNEDNEAKGYYAWDQYLDMLRKRGVTHTGVVATRIKFDARMAYPKLLFGATRWLVPEELAIVKTLTKDERVPKLLNASDFNQAHRNEKKAEDDGKAAPPPAAAKPAAKPAKPAAQPQAQPAQDSQDYDDEPPPPPGKGKAVQQAAAASDEDDDAPPPPPPGKGKAAAPAAASSDEDDDAPPPPPGKGAKGNGAAKPAQTQQAAKGAKAAPAASDALAGLVGEWTGAKKS